MNNKIIVCGINCAGKSTLGKALSEKTGWLFKDAEDYYFPKSDSEYPYEVQRTQEEVAKLLYEDLSNNENFIFAAVKGNYNSDISAMFTSAVFISAPKEIRMRRVRERSYLKFSNRVLEGGDLYEKEEAFFDFVEKRSDNYVTEWLETLNIPVIEIDGTQPVEESVAAILKELSKIN